MFEVGRICFKIAGRDANKYCVIVDKIDDNFVMVDGQTRRKKVNIRHLEPTKETFDIEKGADTKAVAEAFKDKGIEVRETTPKKASERPKRTKVKKEKPVKKKAAKKKSGKKSEKKAEGSSDKEASDKKEAASEKKSQDSSASGSGNSDQAASKKE